MPELLRAGGLVALVASVFDMLDGRVARLRGRETKFGAFLDSTMDRYSDMVLYMGVMILYARVDNTPHMILVWVAAFGSFMTSYARARAETLVPSCTVGSSSVRSGWCCSRRRADQPDGGGAVDHRRAVQRDRDPARRVHLRRAEEGMGPSPRRSPGDLNDDRRRLRRRLLRPWNFRPTSGRGCPWPPAPACRCAASTGRRARCRCPADGGRRTLSDRRTSRRRRWRRRCRRGRRP